MQIVLIRKRTRVNRSTRSDHVFGAPIRYHLKISLAFITRDHVKIYTVTAQLRY